MKLSINLFTSLDGVAQGPGNPEEDPRFGFTRGGWYLPVADAQSGVILEESYSHTTAMLFGRRTYDIFLSYWPQVTDPDNLAAANINNARKYVVTSSPIPDTWADTTTVLGADFREKIQELKQEKGDELQIIGSIQLSRTLHEAGMVDLYRLIIAPVVVGQGLRLFGEEGPAYTMTVTSSAITDNGLVALEMTPGPFRQAASAVAEGRDTSIEV